MSQPDADFIVKMRESRLIERFRLWYALWPSVNLDLADLGITFETRVRVSQILNDLANIVLTVGTPPNSPPAA